MSLPGANSAPEAIDEVKADSPVYQRFVGISHDPRAPGRGADISL